jgi:hypothetical protein
LLGCCRSLSLVMCVGDVIGGEVVAKDRVT